MWLGNRKVRKTQEDTTFIGIISRVVEDIIADSDRCEKAAANEWTLSLSPDSFQNSPRQPGLALLQSPGVPLSDDALEGVSSSS